MTVDAPTLRSTFDSQQPLTVGLEEELMLLDPESLELTPAARRLLEAAPDGAPLKLELPASQLEIVTRPAASVAEAMQQIADGRRLILELAADRLLPAAGGLHPFSPAEGELDRSERYAFTRREYGPVARRQLVFALQVHVAVGGADRTLAVYNALRSYLPELMALAANAPFHEGRDTGFATYRPKVAEALPRQGVPPPLAGWEEYADAFAWGAAAGVMPGKRLWWWELRPHPIYGTLELRVPDTQTTVGDAAGIAATAQALVAHLAGRFDAGEPLPVAPTWRIEENRWSASRYGLEGSLADLGTGERRPTRDRLRALLDLIAGAARKLGSEAELEEARRLVEHNGALRQRDVAGEAGLRGVVEDLVARFPPGSAG